VGGLVTQGDQDGRPDRAAGHSPATAPAATETAALTAPTAALTPPAPHAAASEEVIVGVVVLVDPVVFVFVCHL